jgi:uncharacterized protein YyaL (SSP411 family)
MYLKSNFVTAWVMLALISLCACDARTAPPSKKTSPKAGSMKSNDSKKSTLKENASGFLGRPLPGALPYAPAALAKLKARWNAKKNTNPRTRHREKDGSPKYTNQLLLESSPYLRQHAHNPVNFYPWGDEAFALAKKLNRPVLLSVGYSTCHWCHVMEEESFDDVEIATYMNANYITVKVDREERPDVDAVYMSAVQAMTGSGGWPMTVWLTPDRKPYFGGTYFPARDGDRGARFGFLTLLKKLRSAYDEQRERVIESAQQLTATVRQNLSGRQGGGTPTATMFTELVTFYKGRFDARYGGTQGAPKFPSSLPVRALLRYHRRTGDAEALNMATLSLKKMADGGMYDHVAGGFHRYSTDAVWLVPHFEKMLYDNALLTVAYLEAYQVTKDPYFVRVVREVLRYVERDMTSPKGAFYSATDADSLNPRGHREEGWFFTWTPKELEAALGKEQSRLISAYYAVTTEGNFEGRTILNTPESLPQVAERLKVAPAELQSAVAEARETLYTLRKSRPAPILDTKILTAWNGLMISAHARAGGALGEEAYIKCAERAADFVLKHMKKDGRLLRSYAEGEARYLGSGWLLYDRPRPREIDRPRKARLRRC